VEDAGQRANASHTRRNESPPQEGSRDEFRGRQGERGISDRRITRANPATAGVRRREKIPAGARPGEMHNQPQRERYSADGPGCCITGESSRHQPVLRGQPGVRSAKGDALSQRFPERCGRVSRFPGSLGRKTGRIPPGTQAITDRARPTGAGRGFSFSEDGRRMSSQIKTGLLLGAVDGPDSDRRPGRGRPQRADDRLCSGLGHEPRQLLVFRQDRPVHVRRPGTFAGRRPGPACHGRGTGPQRRPAQAPGHAHCPGSAQRLRHRPQSRTWGGGRHRRHPARAVAGGAARRAGPRNQPYPQPRHPGPVHRGGARRCGGDVGQHGPMGGHFRRLPSR